MQKKKEELAEMEEKVQNVTEAQLETVSGINKTLEEAEKQEASHAAEENNETEDVEKELPRKGSLF